MAPRDRTSEFHSTLSSIKSRTALPSGGQKRDEAKQRLISHDAAGGPSGTGAGASGSAGGSGKKSEFGRMAGGIAKDINSTTLKLQKLAQCEWRRCGLARVWDSSRCWCDLAGKGAAEGAMRRSLCEGEWRGRR
jgi:syntaxin 5